MEGLGVVALMRGRRRRGSMTPTFSGGLRNVPVVLYNLEANEVELIL